MRHQKIGRKFNRTASHRKALMAALSTALIKHKKISTTLAKAKEMRRYVEPMITRARDAWQQEKSGGAVDVHSRREIYKTIRDREAIQILFGEIAEKVGTRPGGYTRVLKLGRRQGDSAEMAVIELVDYNEAQDTKRRRARVTGSKVAQDKRRERSKEVAAATPAAALAVDAQPVVEDAAVVDETPVTTDETMIASTELQTPAEEAPATEEAPAEDAPKAEPTA